ncbi:MAG: protein kinase [Elusimicrobia bacterium]|nr:protein kinase [Elusimicrobiota bacterium]
MASFRFKSPASFAFALALAFLARAAFGAPSGVPTINQCDGPGAAINPNCGGTGALAPVGSTSPSPPGGGRAGSGGSVGGGLTGGSAGGATGGSTGGAGGALSNILGKALAQAAPGGTPGGAPAAGSGGAAPPGGGSGPASGPASAHPSSPFGPGSELAIKAGVQLQMGDLSAACETSRAALALDPKDAKALKIEGLACRSGLSSGPKAVNGGDLKPAPGGKEVALDAGSRSKLLRGGAQGGAMTGPGALQAWLVRIEETKGLGDDAQVIMLCNEALQEFPGNTHLLDSKATAQNKLKDFKGALAAADEALSLDSKDAVAWANRAFALGGLGDKKGMIASLREAAALDPRFEAALKAALADEAAGLFDAAAKPGFKLPALPAAVWVGVPAALGFFLMLIVVLLARRRDAPAAAAPSGPVAPRSIGAGDVLGGNFRVDGEVGRGGMGIVYDAHDEKLDRRVAIKQLQRDAGTTPADVARFLKEARLVAKLKHPNLAEIHTVLEERGELLLVFEFVDGRTLDKVIATNRGLPLAQAEKILEGIAEGLDYAHRLKIIHRDLKPSNVMVSRDGATVKVMDFGIAHQATATGLTRTEASGTPPYMAPEQGMGSVSKASDLYALGVMAYEMVCGARPFDGPDFLEPKLRKEFTPVTRRGRALPAGLDAFFAAALDPDPTKRPATGAAFLLAFRQALA